MKIEILGTGCTKCAQLLANTEQAVRETGVQAEIVKVTELREIVRRGVMFTPALAIDGTVRSSGKVLSSEEITRLFPAG
ncbi:MAG: thioredoxin family protein [Chlamydiota bacterium]